MHYNKDNDETPDKKRKQQEYGHCLIMLPKSKNLLAHESSQQTVNICSTNAIHAKRVHTYAPEESTGVQNVSVIILHVLKTIFQHWAEFSC